MLADGPDPTSDPIGYAEAQIRPLQQVRTGDEVLRAAIDRLDAAYREVFATDDAGVSRRKVAAASDRLSALCPGGAQ